MVKKKSLIKLFLAICICLSGIMLFVTNSYATVFDFTPYLQDPHYWDGNFYDLDDLDHWYYYQWVIDWSIPAGEDIVSAALRFDDINDWVVESGDSLYIHLLDFTTSDTPGVTYYYDGQGGGDNFGTQGVSLPTYHDYGASPEDWSHTFTAAEIASLTSYAADGRFGFGFDPDCHYFNNGVSFQITTSRVPEPATVMLFGAGFLGYGLIRRKFKREGR